MTNQDAVIEYARSIDKACEMLVKATRDEHAPAELLWDLSGFLGSAMSHLSKLYPQLAEGARSAVAMNEVHDQRRDPLETITVAMGWLNQAAEGSEYLFEVLSGLQATVNSQRTIGKRPTTVLAPMEPRAEVEHIAIVAAGLSCGRCATVLEVSDGQAVCPNGHPRDGDGAV